MRVIDIDRYLTLYSVLYTYVHMTNLSYFIQGGQAISLEFKLSNSFLTENTNNE